LVNYNKWSISYGLRLTTSIVDRGLRATFTNVGKVLTVIGSFWSKKNVIG